MWFYFPIAQECGILKPLSKWCKWKIRVGQPVLCPAKYYISLNFELWKPKRFKRLLFIMMYLHINGTKYVPPNHIMQVELPKINDTFLFYVSRKLCIWILCIIRSCLSSYLSFWLLSSNSNTFLATRKMFYDLIICILTFTDFAL